jgi:hypothetical protein
VTYVLRIVGVVVVTRGQIEKKMQWGVRDKEEGFFCFVLCGHFSPDL